MKINQTGILLIVFSIALIVILSFVKIDVDAQASFLCEQVHSNPDIEVTACPAHESNTSSLLTASFGMAFLILGVGAYMTMSKPPVRPDEKKEFKELDLSKLNEEEKKVYTVLRNNKGSMYQGDVVKETGFTKVKTSRILDKLEQNGVLERKRRGMTNIVVLK